ncbi:MAG: hypothetical protein QXF76_01430 [Candidatus Anstonellales archaeon]
MSLLITNSKKLPKEKKNFLSLLALLLKAHYYRRREKNLLELINQKKHLYSRICIGQKDSQGIKLVFLDISKYPYEYLNPLIIIKDYEFIVEKKELKKILQNYHGLEIISKNKILKNELERLLQPIDLLALNLLIKATKEKIQIYADNLKLFEAKVIYARRKAFK